MKLEFKKHSHISNGVHAKVELCKGYTLSVVGGEYGFYGNGVDTFEIAIFGPEGGLIDLPNGDQVMGYCRLADIEEFIDRCHMEGIDRGIKIISK